MCGQFQMAAQQACAGGMFIERDLCTHAGRLIGGDMLQAADGVRRIVRKERDVPARIGIGSAWFGRCIHASP